MIGGSRASTPQRRALSTSRGTMRYDRRLDERTKPPQTRGDARCSAAAGVPAGAIFDTMSDRGGGFETARHHADHGAPDRRPFKMAGWDGELRLGRTPDLKPSPLLDKHKVSFERMAWS